MTSPPTIRIAEPGPGERLAPDDALGKAELGGDRADLVLEQHPQRLDQVEVEVLGQAADVVVRLDRRRRRPVAAGLDHVGVERALDEEAGVVELRRLLLEDADELLADDLALALGLVDAGEPGEEALGGVDVDQAVAEALAEGRDDLLGLVLAHQAVVDEHAGELVADRPVDEQRRGRRVDAAGEPADDARRRRPGRGSARPARRSPRPATSALAAGDLAQEALEDLGAVGRVDDLGVELDPVEAALRRSRRRRPASRGSRRARRSPAGASKTVSRWLIQHCCSAGSPASRRPPPLVRVSSVRPNSPASAPSTRPPSAWTIACIP